MLELTLLFKSDNDLRRIQNVTHSTVSGDFFNQSYTWDEVGNKTGRALIGGASYSYFYDLLNRMNQSVKLPDGGSAITTTYALDAVGNRTVVTGGSDPGSYTLDDSLPLPNDETVNKYTTTPLEDMRLYDANGNLTLLDRDTTNDSPDPLTEYDAIAYDVDNRFDFQYAFFSNDFKKAIAQFSQDPYLSIIYKDNHCTLFEIHEKNNSHTKK